AKVFHRALIPQERMLDRGAAGHVDVRLADDLILVVDVPCLRQVWVLHSHPIRAVGLGRDRTHVDRGEGGRILHVSMRGAAMTWLEVALPDDLSIGIDRGGVAW